MYKMPPHIFNRSNSKGTHMPRPKSELTGDSKHIGARLTKSHFQEWKRLGGAQWLRRILSNSLKEQRDAKV